METRFTIKNIALLFLLTILSLDVSFAQTKQNGEGIISGIVVDAKSKEGVELVNILLLQPKDSTLIFGISASDTGGFSFSQKYGKYIMEVSQLGYVKTYQNINISPENPSVELDTIFLEPSDIFLQEIQVVAELPAMQVKGDTIEFNAGAYSIDGSTLLSDLIKQIPGLELGADGSLKANGKVITKILLDGKEFFGNDINKALTTLPATMINKLQLFEKESEEAKASGIKDTDPEMALNLDIKPEFKKSLFGSTKSGIGNKGRHVNNFNVNSMHGENQYFIAGNINNINDYGGAGYGGYSMNTNFGDNISKDLSANFNIQRSEKVSINGSASYQNDKARNESISDSYTSILDQYSNRSNTGVNRRQGVGMNVTLDWRPDSLTTIYLRTSASYSDGRNTSNSIDSATIVNKSITSTETTAISKSKGFNINNSLMISRRLNSKGRNISFNIGQGYNNNNGNGERFSEKIYWMKDETEIMDQRSKDKSKNTSYSISARYVEPINDDNKLYFSYSININDTNRDNDVRNLDPLTGEYTILDTDYSRESESYSLRQNIRTGFQHRKEKYNFNLEFAVNPSHTHTQSFLEDVLVEGTNIKQKIVNYSPNFRFGWTPNKKTRISFNYTGYTNHPSVNQLSPDTIKHNAMSKSVGNPNLKPSFDNNIGIDFSKSDYESGSFFSANISYGYTFNSTVSYQEVDENSNRVSTYRNVDGNSRANLYLTYNKSLKNNKFNFGGNFNSSYNRNIGFINQQKNIIDRFSLSPNFFGRFYSSKVETSLNFGISHTIAKNNLSAKEQSNNTDYRLSNNLKIKLPFDIAIESNLSFSYRAGLGENVKKDETLWNLSASKLFLKDKKGIIRVEVFDVLNDLRQQTNIVNGSDFSNYWQKNINNYFIISFSYNFNIPLNKG